MGCNASKGGEVSTGKTGQSQATPRDTGNSSNQDENTAANKQDGFQSIQDTQTSEKPTDGDKPEVNEKQEVNEQQQEVQESEKKEVQATEE